jgi:cbb3-type cytochrome oxidase subunit 3
MNTHLTSSQLAGWFAGERRRDVLNHLHDCRDCQAEISGFENTLGHFRTSVRAWSGAQFDPAAAVILPTTARSIVLAGWLTAAFALLLVASVTWHFGAHKTSPMQVARTSDDALLQQVDEQISRTVPTPMAPLTELVSWDGKSQHDSAESQ